MFTWKRLFLAIGSILLLALLFVTLILPSMIIDRAKLWVAEETGRGLEIGSVSINPFSLSVEIRNLDLSDTDHSKSFIAWELLRISISSASIYHRALVLDQVSLEQPRIHLEKVSAERFNFSDLIPSSDAEPPDVKRGEPSRFSLNNISIQDGQIDFVDDSLEQQIHHTVRELTLVLPSIGNLPYMIDDPAQPLFHAVINDAALDLEGKVRPFTDIQEMQFDLDLENIDLPFYLGYVPIDLPVDVRNGKLSLALDILYRLSAESGSEVELSGNVNLAALDIWDKQQEQLFFLPLLQLEIAPSQPLKQDLHLSDVRIYNLEVQLTRDQTGFWNHARMAATTEHHPPLEIDEQTEPALPFNLLIDRVSIYDGVVHFRDDFPAGGFKSQVRAINIMVSDFALNRKNPAPFTLAMATVRSESFKASGQLLLDPFDLILQAEIKDLPLAAYAPYYADFYNQPLGGLLGVETRILVNQEQPLLISDSTIALRNASSAFNDREGARIEALDISGLSYDLTRNHLEVDTLSSTGATINFSRDQQGEWSFMSQNFPILAKGKEPLAPGNKQPEQQQGSAFSYRIGDVAIKDWNLDVHDRLPKKAARIQIDALELAISNLAAPEKTKSPFTLTTTLQRKGKLELKGSTSLADQETFVTTRLRGLPLASLSPYVAEQANLEIAGGALNTDLNTTIIPVANTMQITFDGNTQISRMHLLDGTRHRDLLKWDNLQIAGIKGAASPFKLAIDSITLSDYFARVLIDEQARLNLAEAFTQTATDNTEEQEAAQEPETVEPVTNDASVPDIRIGKVILQGGHVDFTDRNLPRPFQADMRELGGLIEGLNSANDASATVDLRGHLRNQSPLSITGAINPLAKELFLNLKLDFKDIEMSPFSPYSGNFVGYLIEKGKLNLELDYVIENHQLKASNKVLLDQFTFGEEVESEEAINLPVKLAVALLKDGKGQIHLDIPVYGNLDDPQFSIGGVIWTIIKNLLVKAATSPFALLGALAGGGDEDFSNITFDYGTARLNDVEKDKLQRMAQALLERPTLQLEVSGFIDPENDPEGYRREQLATQVKRLRYLDLAKEGQLPEGTEEDDIVVDAEEYHDYLWQIYTDADFPKPRNFIGMIKRLPETEQEKLIYANTSVSEEQLSSLARARGRAVQNFLVEIGQLGRERIFLKEQDITALPGNQTGVRARVELGATVR